MPQLNPGPWFLILLLSWTALLIMFKTKTLSLLQQNTPTTIDMAKQQTAPWNWPWT